MSRDAFRKTLDEVAVSIRSSAPLMHADKTLAQRIATNGFSVPPLRSARLAIPFCLNLLRECIRAYGKLR